MTELPDDELDKLFRKSSEEFDPLYEPKDWSALRKRLDLHDGKTPYYWLKKWWPIALLAFIVPVGLGYYWLHGAEEQTSVLDATQTRNELPTDPAQGSGHKVEATETKGDLPSKNNQTRKLKGDANKAEEGTNVIKAERDNKTEEVNGKTTKGAKYSIRLRKTEVDAEVSSVKSKNTSLPTNIKGLQNALDLQLPKQTISKTIEAKPFDNHIHEPMDIVSTPLIEETAVGSDIPGLKRTDLSLLIDKINGLSFISNESLPLPAIAVPQNDIQPAESLSRDLSPQVAVRFGYSPDMTTVGLKDFSKPGSAVSLMFEYSISRKLYLQTGVVRSVKDYRAGAEDYALSKYVTNINTPYSVDGVCTMIEIPVGLRFDLAQKHRSRWFAGAGISSYYVQKEKYTYYYEQYVQGQLPGWKGKTGWFLLSHLNASAGYERRISNKLSILAEPYIQLPLKGVGYGKVNLITTGMWLSVRYTPFFNR